MNETPAVAVAMGGQLHSEITERGNKGFEERCAEVGFKPDEDQRMLLEIGVQAGLHAAMKVLAERGWIRVQP